MRPCASPPSYTRRQMSAAPQIPICHRIAETSLGSTSEQPPWCGDLEILHALMRRNTRQVFHHPGTFLYTEPRAWDQGPSHAARLLIQLNAVSVITVGLSILATQTILQLPAFPLGRERRLYIPNELNNPPDGVYIPPFLLLLPSPHRPTCPPFTQAHIISPPVQNHPPPAK